MSSRPMIAPFAAITNGDMSGNIISKVSVIQNVSMVSYAISWVGTSPVGVMSIQVSNDYSQNVDGSVKNAGLWQDVALSEPCAVTGTTGDGVIDGTTGVYAIRLVYTRGSGTGTMQATLNCKVQ